MWSHSSWYNILSFLFLKSQADSNLFLFKCWYTTVWVLFTHHCIQYTDPEMSRAHESLFTFHHPKGRTLALWPQPYKHAPLTQCCQREEWLPTWQKGIADMNERWWHCAGAGKESHGTGPYLAVCLCPVSVLRAPKTTKAVGGCPANRTLLCLQLTFTWAKSIC